ncbi:MAG: VIT1/CCC1 transporter family protein, partial [Thermodesulfobacteriota bacterium]
MNDNLERVDISELKKSHTPSAIKKRLDDGPSNIFLKDFIYGAIDGTITTFAIVSGVYGAKLSSGVIIILGLANLIADGFSMGISNYLGTKSEEELIENAKTEELNHIKHYPEGEKEEIRQIFSKKGFTGNELENAVNIITSDLNRWIETMVQDELGYSLSQKSPLKSGATTFFAFVLIGFIPLLSFIVNWLIPDSISNPFLLSSVLT